MKDKKQILNKIREILFEIQFTRDEEKKKELQKKHEQLKKEYAKLLSEEMNKKK